MLSMVKLLLKGEVGVFALNNHGNYNVDRGKSWKNRGIVYLNFCGNPDVLCVANVLTDYDHCQHLQTSDSTLSSLGNSKNSI